MVQTIGQIYEQMILPKFTIPYFSDNFHAEETWISSVTFPPPHHGLQKQQLPSDNTIPPYNIQHYIQPFRSPLLDCIEASSKITAIMIVEELSPINRAKCYTHFLEYCLLAYARDFHFTIDKDSFPPILHDPDYCGLKYFAQWFSYAYPSTKILVGLWTSCYLLRRVKPKWYPPAGFCSGAISYLEVRFYKAYFLHPSYWFLNTQKYSLDPTGELHSWLEGLTERSTNYSDDFEDSDSDSEDEQETYMDKS